MDQRFFGRQELRKLELRYIYQLSSANDYICRGIFCGHNPSANIFHCHRQAVPVTSLSMLYIFGRTIHMFNRVRPGQQTGGGKTK